MRMQGEYGCAAYLAKSESLIIVWANDSYLRLLDEPYRSEGVTGLPLSDVSPLAAVRREPLREVLRTGAPQSGEDQRLTAEEGATVLSWHAYRPLPDYVLVIIHSRPTWPPLEGEGEY